MFLVSICSVAAQGEGPIVVDEYDSPLVITGLLGEGGGFEGNMRLTSIQGDVESFIFLASDLTSEDGVHVVGRQHVSIVGDATLDADIPKNFMITITGVEAPGTYIGTLEILERGEERERALVVPLTVIAKAQPSLSPLPGTDRVQLKLVRSLRPWRYSFSDVFLHDSAFLDVYKLKFKNEVQAAARVLDSKAVLLGEHTGHQLTGDELSLELDDMTIGAGEIGVLQMKIDRSNIPPDHYTGNVYISVEGMAGWLTVPMDLYMRNPPLFPSLVLVFGIVLGRLVQYMKERGTPQAEALRKLYVLRAKIEEAHEDDQNALKPMIDRAKKMTYGAELDKLDDELLAIEKRLEVLNKIRLIEEEDLQGKEKDPIGKQVIAYIKRVRKQVERGEDEKVGNLMKKLDPLLTELEKGADISEMKNIEQAKNRANEAKDAAKAAAETPTRPVPSRYRRGGEWFLKLLTGSAIPAEVSLWFIPPFLYITLVVGLYFVGMGSLYVDKGLSFGANPLADYMGLFLWGLSSDVASRTLTNLGELGGGGG
jgi:hypothetical protein